MVVNKSIWDFILDLLFPKKCVSCGKGGDWFCGDCLLKITHLDFPFVRLAEPSLDGLIAVAEYKNSLRQAIHAFKYDGVRELAKPFSELLVQHLADDRLGFVRQAVLVPVPLHRSREIERGFNQSTLLAEEVGQKLNLPVKNDLLVKIKKTKPQRGLKKEERRKNLKDVFSFAGDKKEIKGKKILLVDDVATTGSTLRECAKVLKKAGAKQIWGLVLAKG